MGGRWVHGPAGKVMERLMEDVPRVALPHPWWVVVPGARAREVVHMRLAQRGASLGVRVLTLPSLAARLAPPPSRPPLSAAARTWAMRRALTQEGLRDTPSLCQALLGWYDRLRALGRSPREAQGELGEAVVRVLERFALWTSAYPDAARRWEAAEEALKLGVAQSLLPPSPLCLAGFWEVTPREASFLAQLAQKAVVWAYVPDPPPGMPPLAGYARLRQALQSLDPEPLPASPAARVYRVGLSAPAAEADEAARRVAKLLDEGLSPGEVTVVGPLSLLKRTARRLERLGMATRLPLPRLSATPAGEAALRLVRLVAQDHPDALAAFLDQPAWEPEPGSAAALRRALGRVALATARQTLERLAQGQRPHPQGEEEASTPASLPPSRQAGQLLAGLLAASLKRLAACPPDLASRAQALAEELGALVPMTGDTPQARLWRAVVQAVRRVGEAQVLNLGGGEWHDVGLLLEAELESSPAPPQLPQAVPVELLEPSDGAVAWARAVVVLGMAAEDLVFSSPHVWDPEEMASQAYRPAWGSALAMASGEEVYGLYTAVGRLGPRPPSPLLEGVPECAPLSTTLSEWEAVGRCLGGSQGLSPEARRRLAQGEGPLAAPARWRAAHEEPEPTPYDGHVGDLAGGEAALPRAPSATSLEEMGRCPYRYFLNRLVGLGEGDEEDPWANWDLERWEWGVVAHAVLWRVRQRARAQGVEPLRPGVEPWLAEAVREACQEALGPYGHRTLAPVALRALEEEVWNVLWADMAEGDGETVAAEWTFGPDEASRLDLRLPTFGTVSLRGRVDRIWRRGDGTWVVEDYKTGRDLPSTQVGPGNLQMAAYILAVRAAFGPERVVGRYRSVRGKGLFRSRWLEEVEEREVASLVEEAYARMAQGRFPPHPGRHCSSCPYQAVCPPEGEREERARRKGLVPGLTRARREEG